MKSVGEGMSIGRTFRESFQKGLRSASRPVASASAATRKEAAQEPLGERKELRRRLQTPGPNRIFRVREALRAGWSVDKSLQPHQDRSRGSSRRCTCSWVREDELRSHTRRSPPCRTSCCTRRQAATDSPITRSARSSDFPSSRCGPTVSEPRHHDPSTSWSIPALVSSRPLRRTTTPPTTRKTSSGLPRSERIMILGGGPNRIGQGIEFDYCCVQASFALREAGYETIMVNSNPGDGLHGLRHERPALLRAAHRRARAWT